MYTPQASVVTFLTPTFLYTERSVYLMTVVTQHYGKAYESVGYNTLNFP